MKLHVSSKPSSHYHPVDLQQFIERLRINQIYIKHIFKPVSVTYLQYISKANFPYFEKYDTTAWL